IDPMADPGIGHVEEQGIPATAVFVTEPESDDQDGADGDGDGDAKRIARPVLIEFDPDSLAVRHPTPDAYSLRLVVHRCLYDGGTGVQPSPHLAPLAPEGRVHVHATDLEHLGLSGGGRVRLQLPRSTIVVDVEADPGLTPGSAAMPFNVPIATESGTITAA